MATIISISKGELGSVRKSKDTDAVYYVIDDFEERYLQIDTFGSKDRKYPEKVSQSIRINKKIAVELIEIMKKNFNL